jgi:hypothetical protein
VGAAPLTVQHLIRHAPQLGPQRTRAGLRSGGFPVGGSHSSFTHLRRSVGTVDAEAPHQGETVLYSCKSLDTNPQVVAPLHYVDERSASVEGSRFTTHVMTTAAVIVTSQRRE